MLFPIFKLSYPKSGSYVFSLLISMLMLGAIGCSDTPAPQEDGWRLSPPELIGTTGDGKSTIQSAKGSLPAQDFLQFNLESYLKFSKADRGLKLEFETQCDALFHSGTMLTAEVVSLARMVPPQILGDSPPASSCDINIAVINAVGSSHRFQLLNVKLFANAIEEKLKSSDQELHPTLKHEPLRLVCGSWWSEEDRESINAALSLEARIWTLTTAETVAGTDDRKQRFRPTCRLFQLRGDSEMDLIKSTQLLLPGLETALAKSIVLTPHSHYTFLREPLIEWRLQNKSGRSQIIFITSRNQNLKMSYANVNPSYPFGWSKMISVPFEFRFLSSQNAIESTDGTFIELPAGQIMTMQLKLKFDAHCIISLHKLSTPYLRFELGTPIKYSVLERDIDLVQLSPEKETVAKNILADDGNTVQIFSSQVIEFGTAPTEMKDGGMFSEAEQRLGAGLQMPFTSSSQCYHGQLFDGSPQWRRPVLD